jgi:hypothetical protein
LRYRVNGLQRRYTLGPADPISRTQARRIANGLLLKVREGVDPADEKRTTTIRAGGVRDSFAELAEDYIERYCKVHNRSWIDLARVLGLATDKYSREAPGTESPLDAQAWVTGGTLGKAQRRDAHGTRPHGRGS